MSLEEYFQIELGTEQFRAPEIIFQPSLVGIDQAGLVETLLYVLKHYDASTQDQLVNVSGHHIYIQENPHTIPKLIFYLIFFSSSFFFFIKYN